ncbi:hypothetical protein Pint_21134 [Pistacia integerrima]|uniref:Uncharacterized protein n=1 Tax=Pistacia integerrima TaxID=434235 RepID=A0ACC0X8N9_9ROSI|nr:hypothetical protein Pint_21134 [Pistacia integerrima]
MKPHSLIFFFFFMYLFYQPSNCQQKYPNNTLKNCTHTTSKSDLSKGYLCNGPENTSCQSFLTFHSHPPYNSPSRIAHLLGSEASSVTLINGFSSNDKSLPPGTLVIVPVSCSCSGSVYHHKASYTIRKNDTYFSLANDTFQGLTTCQALMSQNYYDAMSLVPDSELMAPLRCACPSLNQTAEGVSSLLTYMVEKGDTSASTGNRFGVDEDSILEGNMLLKNSTIYPFTPLLIPLKWKSCKKSPKYFYCYCPNGFLADGTQQGLNCKPDSKKFPVKLVTLLAKENRLLEVLDTRVAEEAEEEEIQAIAELAMRCLRLKGKKRPTMKEVAMELEGLRKSQRCIEISQEPQPLRDDDQNAYVHGAEESGQESVSDSKLFPLFMESSSF